MNNQCEGLIAQFTTLRKQRKITQRELATRTGIAQGNIALIENGGREPQISTLLRLFKAIGYTLSPVAIDKKK